jgi:uncharacterized protein DUF222/HNH endonuclease
MSDELEMLEAASLEFERQADVADVDPARLAAVIDRLQGKLCSVLNRARQRGDHLSDNISAVSWVARTCGLSRNAAADRLCVGKQLESLPRIAQALSSGQIGYQAAAVICHLQDKLGDQHGPMDEEQWIGWAGLFSIKTLDELAQHTRHVADPDGFAHDAEEDFEQRQLHISRLRNLFVIDGTLDAEGGAALKTAIDALAKRHAPDDDRTPRQRRADALVELVYHALDEGRLPRRNGVRPHVTVTTSLECLKQELGAPAAELEQGVLVSSRTVERLACDGTLSRVLLADSVVTDVGRATRAVSPGTKRALRARDRGCRFPGCDRPLNWSSPHHIEFWARGGPTRLSNLVLLCWYHHRCVHEGEWQVVKDGAGFRFVPPDRVLVRRARGPGLRWAA